MNQPQAKKVLLIGWDAADWKVIHPLLDAGKMPALERLLNQGVMAHLATLHPVLSPMLWTSIATGKRPFKHGILGFTEPTDDGQALRPITNLSRKTKAIWNILNQCGKTSNVVGWWPSHPAEPIRGVMVSNHYQQAVGPPDQPWPMPPGTVHPPDLRSALAELRLNPNELGEEHILPFIPRAAEIDQDQDRRLASCAKILAECTTVHAAATWLMTHQPWDFMAVYYDAIDHFGHGFMRYHPPRREHVPEKDYELYQGVIEAGYRYHDLMLHSLLNMAGDETTVVLMSDHGFHPDHLRPRGIPREPAGPAIEHRDFGILVIRGPGIRQDEIIHGANLLDITPTILTLFDLPLGADMDGKPLLEAFEQPPEVETISSWDQVEGDSGQHPADRKLDPFESQEAIRQLVALGYIEQPDEDREKAIANTLAELRFNLTRSYIDADLHAEAMPHLAELYQQRPGEYRYGVQLAMCYRALGHLAPLRQLVEAMNQRRRMEADEAREQLKQMAQMIEERKAQRQESQPDTGSPTGDRKQDDDERLLSDAERAEIIRLRSLANVNTYALDYLMGIVFVAEGKHEDALEYLARAAQAEPDRPGLHVQIGEAYLKVRHWAEAERAFAKAAEYDPDNPHAHLGLCRSYLPRRKNRLAIQEALTAVGRRYHFPLAHYMLAVGLQRVDQIHEAVQALEVAVAQNPNFRQAHLRLARIYRRHFDDPVKEREHLRLADQLQGQQTEDDRLPVESSVAVTPVVQPRVSAAEPELTPLDMANSDQLVTIVSGLPRSGTSLMMKMIAAGGMEVLTDGQRAADEDNPQGYFEFEAVKRTRQDASWLEQAGGKAVKMVHLLVPQLPINRRYKLILMRRDLDEVLASQRKMLERNGRPGGNLPDGAMKRVFQQQLNRLAKYLATQPAFQSMDFDYNQLLANPAEQAERLKNFLNLPGSPDRMAKVVDLTLYRNRLFTPQS